ncbi:MAG: hypothetical protein ACE14L_03640 [Terriglobales bacterium]
MAEYGRISWDGVSEEIWETAIVDPVNNNVELATAPQQAQLPLEAATPVPPEPEQDGPTNSK